MMFWNRKHKQNEEDVTTIQPPASSRVEVELAKGANKEAVQKANEANQHLNELLVKNGFTLKIYLAAGGHLPNKTKRGVER